MNPYEIESPSDGEFEGWNWYVSEVKGRCVVELEFGSDVGVLVFNMFERLSGMCLIGFGGRTCGLE